ncbi:MAG: hypothetical protein HY906_11095 [Deltaproteobacteria bacterium]|nr:hypothetical protein [Deltaproteobacteria bacterium]
MRSFPVVGALVLGILGLGACDLRTLSGEYACDPSLPGACPAGWVCEIRNPLTAYRCYAAAGPHCGDGTRDPGEVCDGDDFGGDTCEARGFAQGLLRCSATCDAVSADGCSGGCGNGLREGREQCDGQDLGDRTCADLGWHEPAGLGCRDDCTFDDSGCAGGRCGDGQKDGPEDCDGEDLGTATCLDFGYYNAAGLACNALCRFDASACHGECGDGTVDEAEDCDGTELAGASCESLGHHPGTLTCTAGCRFDVTACGGYCGDGVINGGEHCDEAALGSGSGTCESLPSPGTGNYHPGTLACAPDCTFNVAGCGGYCGDGVKNGAEACDRLDVGAATCRDFASPGVGNYYSGSLGCSSDCTAIVTTGCHEYCGDGVRNGTEKCDGADLGGNSCLGFGYYDGSPACLATCDGFDKTGCSGYCGDGIVNGGEFCDGRDQGGESCTSYSRYTSGALGCDAQCRRTFETCVETWSPMTSGTTQGLRGVWGSSATDVFAVGGSGTIRHYNGSAGSPMTSGTTQLLFVVWGSSATDVFAVGELGTILHYNGRAWSPMASGTTRWL